MFAVSGWWLADNAVSTILPGIATVFVVPTVVYVGTPRWDADRPVPGDPCGPLIPVGEWVPGPADTPGVTAGRLYLTMFVRTFFGALSPSIGDLSMTIYFVEIYSLWAQVSLPMLWSRGVLEGWWGVLSEHRCSSLTLGRTLFVLATAAEVVATVATVTPGVMDGGTKHSGGRIPIFSGPVLDDKVVVAASVADMDTPSVGSHVVRMGYAGRRGALS